MTTTSRKRVIIVGGGVIGLCAAHYLRGDGAAVTVLEKGEVGSGSSSQNAGLVPPSHFIPLASPGVISQGLKWMLDPDSPFYIKPRLDPDLIRWIWKFRAASTDRQMRIAMPLLLQLARLSFSLYQDLAKLKDCEFGFQKRGLLMVFNSERGRHHCMEEAHYAHALDLEARVLDPRELAILEPDIRIQARGAVYYPGDAHLSPGRFVEALTHTLLSQGVVVKPSTQVLGFTTSSGRVSGVRTTSGTLEADDIVIAGGAWSPGLMRTVGIRLLLQAGKGYSITLRNPARKPSIPLILTEARVAVTPMAEGLRFAGTMELAGVNLSVNKRRVEAIAKAVPRYLPDFKAANIDTTNPWSGLRPCTPDGLPYIGRFSSCENLIAATGHAMIGISLAPVTGKLVSDIVAERTPSVDLTLMHPDRFE
jgi:D-amino-acid dehydrogenase